MIKQTTDSEHVAWGAGTAGFVWDSKITVAPLWYPAVHADLLSNAPEDAVDTAVLGEHLEACSGGVPSHGHGHGRRERTAPAGAMGVFDRFN